MQRRDIFSGKRTVPTEHPVNGPFEYFLVARASKDVGKASVDMVIDGVFDSDEY